MTPSLNTALLARLGVASPDALRLVDTFPAPTDQVARGRGGRDLIVALATAGLWQPLGQGDRDIAMRHVNEPSFVAFYEEDVAEVIEGSATTKGGLVAFDTHGAQACVRGSDGSVLVAMEGAVQRYEVSAPDPFADLDIPESPPAIPAFESVPWAQAAHAEPWLQDAVAQLAAQRASLPSAASAGLLARLWTRQDGLHLAPADHPRERVRMHMRAASVEQREALEQRAVTRAWALADELRDLDHSAAERTPALVQEMVEGRDDLQSVLRVLRLGGHGDELAHALRGVDAVAEERSASLANVLPSLEDDPQRERWMAVAWQEPSAWWTGSS
jgi:hypothetical protein